MREKPEARLKRLRARKNELLEKMKALRGSTVRNAAHKLDLINDEVNTITIKIMELQGE